MYSLLHPDIGKIVPKRSKTMARGFRIPPSGVARLLVMLAVIFSVVHVLDIASARVAGGQSQLLAQTDISYERR